MLQKIYSDEIFSGTCVFFDKANSILMVSWTDTNAEVLVVNHHK
jgi:hypothetical protein